MTKHLINETTAGFSEHFHSDPQAVYLSPGRINVIGEHIDYNSGYVLPAAIDKYICFAITIQPHSTCRVVALDLKDSYEFDLSEELRPVEKMWMNYILGVIQQFKLRGLPVKGFDVAFASTIPIGSGLSSSAALECGIGFALNELLDLGLSKLDIALIGQKAEHTFAGVMCGIMDQFANVFGEKDKVIKLDCVTLDYEYHDVNFTDHSLFLLDSKVKHTHLTSGYNDRRSECEQGLKIISSHFPEVNSFRDCSTSQVEQLRSELGELIYKRCHFVVREIERVLDAVAALEESRFEELGKLMHETHQGLSQEYEVSCEELDFLVQCAATEPEILGARMMGGGFGGCSINLARKGHEDQIIQRIAKKYSDRFNIELQAYKVNISEGTSRYLN